MESPTTCRAFLRRCTPFLCLSNPIHCLYYQADGWIAAKDFLRGADLHALLSILNDKV
jgi:hypothetical protein